MLATLFGNATAEKVLLFLQNYGEGYARSMAATFELPLLSVQRQLQRLEAGGVLVSKLVGRTRVFTLNPRYYFAPELSSLLEKALEAQPAEATARYYRRRNRPRRSGKSLPS